MRLAARIPIPVLTLHLLLLGAQPAARADDLPGFRPLGCGRTDLMLGQVPALIGASSMQDEVYAYRHATDTPGETVILYWGKKTGRVCTTLAAGQEVWTCILACGELEGGPLLK